MAFHLRPRSVRRLPTLSAVNQKENDRPAWETGGMPFVGVNLLSIFCDLAKMLLDIPEQKF
jgi:hypothetical protein